MRVAPDGAIKPVDPLPAVVKSIDRDDLTSVSALLHALTEIQAELPPLLPDNPEAALARQSAYEKIREQVIPSRKVVLLPLGCTDDKVILKYDPRIKNLIVSFYNFDGRRSEEISQDVRRYIRDMTIKSLEEQERYIQDSSQNGSNYDIPPDLEKRVDDFWKAGNFQRTPSGDFFSPNNERVIDWKLSLWEALTDTEHEVLKFGHAVITGASAKPGTFIPKLEREIARWEKFPISADARGLLDTTLPHEGDSEGLCIIAEVSEPDQLEASWTSQDEQRVLRGWVNRWLITATDGRVVHQSRVSRASE